MKQGKSLMELAAELNRIQSVKKDFIAPTASIEMNEKAEIVLGGEKAFNLTNWSGGQLASYTDIPKQYFDRIREESPELLAKNVNHGLKKNASTNSKEARLVRTVDGKVRGFLSSKYRMLDGADLMEAVLPSLIGSQFQVESSEITEKRLYLKATTAKIEGEIKKGDVVQYGVMISTSDVGAGSLKIEPFFNRLVCMNGLIMPSTFKKMHIGSNNFESQIQELLSDSTKRLNDAAFYATVQDYIKSTMNPENFERELNKMRAASDRKIENFDLEKVVELSMNEVGVRGEAVKKGILHALASGNEGAGLTQWGLVNAFTRAAQMEELDYDSATDLERAGGQVLELSATQWKKIAIA